MNGPTLTTARLILRPPVAADLDGFAALLGDEATARFIGGVQGRHGAWRSMMALAGSWSLLGYGPFSVLDRATGRWIGRVGPWHPEGWPGDEIIYGMLPEAHGRGLAFEAATAPADWTRDVVGWREVLHVIHPDNAPSKALATRLGARPRDALVRLPAPYDAEAFEAWHRAL